MATSMPSVVAACAAMGYPMCLSGYLDPNPVLLHGVSLCLNNSLTNSLTGYMYTRPTVPLFHHGVFHTPWHPRSPCLRPLRCVSTGPVVVRLAVIAI